MLTELQYRLLRKIAREEPRSAEISVYSGKSKLVMALGDDLTGLIRDRIVIDFGCGEGSETLDLARFGAKKAIGLDIRQRVLDIAAQSCEAAGLSDRCEFVTGTETAADVIVSLDAFEHFEDPAGILAKMHSLLRPGGIVLVSFGPTWYHPLGGHLFSVFPWAHPLFSEQALVRRRSHIRSDGARRFSEVEGRIESDDDRPLRAARRRQRASDRIYRNRADSPASALHCRLTREMTTALVRAKLARKA